MNTNQVLASELVFDFTLYPRVSVDAQHVAYIAEAMRAGASFPPVIVDKKSKRVIDGFHRIKAVLRLNPDGKIEVEWKSYRNEQEMFLEAVTLNAGHGRTLAMYDRTRCVVVAEALGIDPARIATALHLTVERITELLATRTATFGGGPVPLKRTLLHMAGRRLTKAQEKAQEKLSGMNQVFYVNQLITLIDADLLDTENPVLMETLRKLYGLLKVVIRRVA